MTYEHKCCRCGFCCLSETCPAGVAIFGISKTDICPALQFNKDHTATCKIVSRTPVKKRDAMKKDMGVGEGCCIKARAYKDGVEYDFAALPKNMKIRASKDRRGVR
uniref:Uncharacterized protein n=1 Tax=viral metagenome TaxID=1070528 RepID=A0A6M3L4A8_9ZZZZ